MKKVAEIEKQSPFKKKAFVLLYELTKWRRENSHVYKFALILETLQLCWYSIAPKFIHNPSAKQWLEKALHAIQLDNALDKNDGNLLLSLLYMAFGWQMLWLALSAYIIWSGYKSNFQRARGISVILKFLNVSAVMTTFLFALPIYQIYLTILICLDERQANGELVCYQGAYFIHFVFAILGIIAHTVISVTVIILFSDINPFSKAPYATARNRPYLYRLWIKLILPLFALLTYKNKSLSIMVYFYAVLWLGALIYRWKQTPDFHRSNYFFKIGTEVLILWLIIYELVRLGIDAESDDASISVTFFLCCPLIVFGVNHVINQRIFQIKTKQIKSFDKDTEAEMYIYMVIDLIQKKKKCIVLDGIGRSCESSCSVLYKTLLSMSSIIQIIRRGGGGEIMV